MPRPNVYTWLFVVLLLLLCAAAFVWGGPFLLMPMSMRLTIATGGAILLALLGVASKLR